MTRTVLFLVVALPAAIFIALMWDRRGGGVVASNPLFSQHAATSRATGAARDRADPFDVWAGRMSEVFIEDPRPLTIGGKLVRYQRHLVTARATEPRDEGAVRASGVTILFNPPPKNEFDVARMVTIEVPISGPEAGRAVRDAFGRVPGVTADEAVLRGTNDLSQLSRVDLKGSARAIFIDPEVPTELVELDADHLTILFENGDPVELVTDAPIVMTRPRAKDLDIRGTGLRMALKDHLARLDSDIHITLLPPEKNGKTGLPVVLTSGGPVEFRPPGEGKTASSVLSTMKLGGGTIHVLGAATVTQGELRATGRQATLTMGTKASSVSTGELVGDVVLTMPNITARGSRLVFQPRAESGESMVLEGNPSTTRILDGAKLLPGNDASAGDLVIDTRGKVTLRQVPDENGITGVRQATFAPDVVLTAGESHAKAKEMQIWIGDVPETTPDGGTTRRKQAYRGFLRETDLTGPALDLVSRETTFRREFNPQGTPRKDIVNLSGPYRVRVKHLPDLTGGHHATSKPTSRAGSRPDSRTASRPDSRVVVGTDVLNGADEVLITGPGTLEMIRPPLADAPIFLTGKGGIDVRAMKTGVADYRARLTAQSAEIVLEPDQNVGPDSGVSQRLSHITAERAVVLDVPGKIKARGGLLRFDNPSRDLVIDRGATGERPTIDLLDEHGPKQTLAASHIGFSGLSYRVTGVGAVVATMDMVLMPWVTSEPHTGTVPTTINCQEATIDLDRAQAEAGRWVPTEIHAMRAVTMDQPGRGATADDVRYDLAAKRGTVDGKKVRLTAQPVVAGVKYDDFVECRGATLLEQSIIVDGPVHGILHVSPDRFALAIRIGEPAPAAVPSPDDSGTKRPSPPKAPEPMTLDCRRQVTISHDVVIANDGVVIEQGDPNTTGVRVEADKATMLLVPSEGTGGGTDVAVAELRGNVSYLSKDLRSNCDVMVVHRGMKKATVFNDRPDKVSLWLRKELFRGVIRNNVSAMTLDYSVPGQPRVELDHPEINMVTNTGGQAR